MPAAYNQEVIGRELAWDNTGQQYVSVNVTVNIPPGYQQQQQQPGQMQMMAQPPQPTLLQQWQSNSPLSEQQQVHRQLQPQHVQHSPVAQQGLAWAQLEQRPDQIPFWQSPQALVGGEAAAGTFVSAALPAMQHVQLQQGTLLAAQPQQHTRVLQLQPQQVLQYIPQQQLQEVPAYALILLPPGASVMDPQQQQQQLQLQPLMMQPELLAQAAGAAASLQATAPAAHRKTRRGPNRGRSKQKKADAAEAGKEAAEPGSLQESQQQLAGKPVARVTSDSASSGPTADSSCSGSGNSGSQGGSADSASAVSAGEAGIGSPEKKRVRRRGRRGRKGSQETAGSQQEQGDEQGEGQASADPLLTEGASAAAAANAAGASASNRQGQAVQQQAGTSSQAAAGQQSQQQQAKRTSGLSHRQRYRRKQWELHRAMEQQRSEAEPQAQLQAQQLLLMQGQPRVQVLATPPQLPPMWQELPAGQLAATAGQLAVVQQLQGSLLLPMASAGMVPPGQLLGSPMVGGMPSMVSAAVPIEAQRAQLLAAAAASAGVAHAEPAGLAEAVAGAVQAVGPSWIAGSHHQQQQQHAERQAAEGAGHVDQNLDEWLSKLLEL
uniref:Uncharacterized protein n=1 Tax=Tetradesmus obliquus TaxID=3088 RepID=A0A383VTM5_TETOB|eukprot:jgi/Sobl393_1/3136/SZX68837.1